jgi:hypothetical protein
MPCRTGTPLIYTQIGQRFVNNPGWALTSLRTETHSNGRVDGTPAPAIADAALSLESFLLRFASNLCSSCPNHQPCQCR